MPVLVDSFQIPLPGEWVVKQRAMWFPTPPVGDWPYPAGALQWWEYQPYFHSPSGVGEPSEHGGLYGYAEGVSGGAWLHAQFNDCVTITFGLRWVKVYSLFMQGPSGPILLDTRTANVDETKRGHFQPWMDLPEDMRPPWACCACSAPANPAPLDLRGV
jgi:hypothetical protein